MLRIYLLSIVLSVPLIIGSAYVTYLFQAPTYIQVLLGGISYITAFATAAHIGFRRDW